MPRIKTDGMAALAAVFKDLAEEIDNICKMGLFEGAHIVADAISEACPEGESGDLRDSLGIATFRKDADGFDTIIGFDGYDYNGVPNQLKARAIESGRSVNGKTVGKHPFVRPAVARARAAAVAIMNETIDLEIVKKIQQNN